MSSAGSRNARAGKCTSGNGRKGKAAFPEKNTQVDDASKLDQTPLSWQCRSNKHLSALVWASASLHNTPAPLPTTRHQAVEGFGHLQHSLHAGRCSPRLPEAQTYLLKVADGLEKGRRHVSALQDEAKVRRSREEDVSPSPGKNRESCLHLCQVVSLVTRTTSLAWPFRCTGSTCT